MYEDEDASLIAENLGCSADNISSAIAAGQTVNRPIMIFSGDDFRMCFGAFEGDSQCFSLSYCDELGAVQSLAQVSACS